MKPINFFSFVLAVVAAIQIVAAPVWADSPVSNEPVTVCSTNQKFCVDMTPHEVEGVGLGWGGYGAGEGKVYEALADGTKKDLWKVPFYSAEAVVTDDGKSLIAFGPWASDLSDLAVSFYREGKELKSYLVRDLIKDESKLQRTVSHFFWRAHGSESKAGLSADESTFAIPLIDGTTVIFDVSTGEMKV